MLYFRRVFTLKNRSLIYFWNPISINTVTAALADEAGVQGGVVCKEQNEGHMHYRRQEGSVDAMEIQDCGIPFHYGSGATFSLSLKDRSVSAPVLGGEPMVLEHRGVVDDKM